VGSQREARWALVRKMQWGGAAEVDEAATLGLTGRDAELARLLIRGWTMREIGAELGMKSAVDAAKRLYRQLGVTGGRVGLREMAGVVDAGGLSGAPREGERAEEAGARAVG